VDILKYLLAKYPQLDVNARCRDGWTPVTWAIHWGNIAGIRLLTNHPLVDLTIVDNEGLTPLLNALKSWRSDAWDVLIESWKDLGPMICPDESRRSGDLWPHTLMKKLQADPEQKLHESRLKLHRARAAGIYALIVFLCDGLLRVRGQPSLLSLVTKTDPLEVWTALATLFCGQGSHTRISGFVRASVDTKAARFFRIASMLPLELQMVLCYRTVGSRLDNIPSHFSERAFKALGQAVWR